MLSTLKSTASLLLLVTLAILTQPEIALAQTGALLPSAPDLSGGSEFTAAPAAEDVTGVDLRHYFPAVGSQSMNDCAAWAIAAAKSCQEAYNQGWTPDRPQTMFSPAFIYPQLNGGKDDGSSLVKAALLLVEKGAATLKTTPYTPKDFTTQPSAFAFEEALRFKNKDAYLLKNQEQIRLVLRENLPVVIGARLTPNFFSGKFDQYTKEMHKEGMKKRKADQPHAMHAMVIVGYDDPTKRFLLRNSWGEGWGQGGYCWVAYEAIEGIDPSKESESFLFVALAMVDDLANAEATPDVGEDLKDTIHLVIRGESAGYDINFKKTKYRFTANLNAPTSAIDLVKEVRWTVPTWNGKLKALTTSQAERGFRVLSSVGGEVHEIGALVTFKDGSTKKYGTSTAFKPLPADARQVSVRSDDFYYGNEFFPPLQKVAHSWTRVIRVEGSPQDIRDIKTLTLKIGDADPEDISPGYEASSVSNHYHHATECLPIEVHFTFADGTQTVRRWDVKAFEDQTDDGAWIKSKLRPVGDGSQSAYSLSVRIPVSQGYSVKDVIWKLDGSQSHFHKVATVSEWKGWEITGSAIRDFRVRATVSFIKLQNKPKRPDIVLEKWIELPDAGTAYPTPQRLEVTQVSAYIGRNTKDLPRWRYDLRLTGDWKATADVRDVRFQFNNSDGARITEKGKRLDDGDWWLQLDGMDANFNVVALVDHPAGKLEFQKNVVSDKPIVDGVFLDVRTHMKWGEPIRWATRIGGSHWYSSVKTMALQYNANYKDIPAKNRYVTAELKLKPSSWQSIFDIANGTLKARGLVHRTSPLPGNVEARLYYNSGAMEVVRNSFSVGVGDWAGPGKDTIQLRTLEHFLGVDDTGTYFNVQFWLDAPQSELDKIDHLLLRDKNMPWSTAIRLAAGQKANAKFDRPGALVARIIRKDNSVEERTIQVTCQEQRFRDITVHRNGATIFLQGPLNLLDKLAKVQFRIKDEAGKEVTKERSEYRYAAGDYACWLNSPGALETSVDLEFKDGSKRTIDRRLVIQTPATPNVIAKDLFWGWYNDKPYWLTNYRVIGGSARDGFLAQSMNSGATNEIHLDWPDYEVLDVISAPQALDVTVHYGDEKPLRLGPFQFPINSPTSKEFTLEVQRSWENPDPHEHAKDEYIFRIAGPLQMLDDVLEVDYTPLYMAQERKIINEWHEVSRWSLDGDGFRGLSFTHKMRSVEAKLTFRDGRDPVILNWTAK